MINGKKIIAVLPAYNAALTLKKTYEEIPFDIVDDVVLVDDHSKDNTSEVAREIGIKHVIRHVKVMVETKRPVMIKLWSLVAI